MLLFIEGGSLQLWLMLIENQSEKRLSLLCSQFELLIEYRIQGLFVDCCLVKLSSTGSKLPLWKQRKLHKWIAQPCRKKEMRQVHSFCVYLTSGNEAVVILWTINSKQSSSSRDNSPTTGVCNTQLSAFLEERRRTYHLKYSAFPSLSSLITSCMSAGEKQYRILSKISDS